MTTQADLKHVRVSVMNAVHDLAVFVARDEGLFRDEGLDLEIDGPTLAAMFRAEARAAELINRNPGRYAHYLLAEAQGLLAPHELETWRLLYGPPAPYTRERFQATYEWMRSYNGLVAPDAAYETVVDNRAWE